MPFFYKLRSERSKPDTQPPIPRSRQNPEWLGWRSARRARLHTLGPAGDARTQGPEKHKAGLPLGELLAILRDSERDLLAIKGDWEPRARN